MKILLNDKLKKFNISKSKLSKMLDISYPTVLDICNNKVSSIRLDVLDGLCEIFQCTPNDILIPDKLNLKIDIVQRDNKPIISNQQLSELQESYKKLIASLPDDQKIKYQIAKDEDGQTIAFPYIVIDVYDEINAHNNKDDTE